MELGKIELHDTKPDPSGGYNRVLKEPKAWMTIQWLALVSKRLNLVLLELECMTTTDTGYSPLADVIKLPESMEELAQYLNTTTTPTTRK